MPFSFPVSKGMEALLLTEHSPQIMSCPLIRALEGSPGPCPTSHRVRRQVESGRNKEVPWGPCPAEPHPVGSSPLSRAAKLSH